MEEALVICIGNPARGDDGVAREVARLLDASGEIPAVVTAVALDVTHAEDVAGADVVVIVDAHRRQEPQVEVVPIDGSPLGRDTHGMTPGALLGLAEKLYGGAPAMWLVSVAAPEMGHTEELSETARLAAAAAAGEVAKLLEVPRG